MKTVTLTTALTLATFAVTAPAQKAPAHAPDGGTRQRIESINIPATANAPFTAVVVTEWTRILPDGNTIIVKNHRTVARDSSGRVFQERRYFAPNGDTQTTPLSATDIEDPGRREMSICHPDTKTCELYPWAPAAAVALVKPGPLPNGSGTVTIEDLGRRSIDNLNVVGSREITTFNANTIGNNKAEPIVKEFWYSPDLGVNLITKRFDPRASAAQDFNVTSINLTEPDPKLFAPPTGYRIVRRDNQ